MIRALFLKRLHRKILDRVPASMRGHIPSAANIVSCTKVVVFIFGMVIIYYIISWSTDNGEEGFRTVRFQITASDEESVFSPHGEDGVLSSIFTQIGVTDGTFVELGSQDGVDVNTMALKEQNGWTGVQMDMSQETSMYKWDAWTGFTFHKTLIFKYSVPREFDLLSTSTDFKDFWISKATLDAGFRPRVIVSEVNSLFRKDVAITVPKPNNLPKDYAFSASGYYFGATPMAMTIMYQSFGYSLVYCEKTGLNCFWVRNDQLLSEDVVKFNEEQHILDTIKCAKDASDKRSHPKYLEGEPGWVKVEAAEGYDDFTAFNLRSFKISAAELDENRCE